MSLNISKHFFDGSGAEAIVLRQAMKNGLIVSLPFGGGVPYDMIVQNSLGKLYTIQVKKVGIVIRARPYKVISVLRSVMSNNIKTQYKEGDTDFFIGCDIETDDYWIIPFEFAKKFRTKITVEGKALTPYKNNWQPLLT